MTTSPAHQGNHFADRLNAACLAKQSRLVVGLDPHWDLIPHDFKDTCPSEDHGETISRFLIKAVDACLEHAVAFKPQIAFFEEFGPAGFHALDRVVKHLVARKALIIMDAKRNDIGSTAAAYARAYFGDEERPGVFPSDALTVNAYTGEDGIRPFLEKAGKGIFVLVKTSNPSSGQFQDVENKERETLAELVARAVTHWNQATIGSSGYGNVGAVVAATYPEHMRKLRLLLPQSVLLVPGYGAQGGSREAVRAAFNKDGLGAVINSSRGILFPEDWPARGFSALEDAAHRARLEINHILTNP